MAQPYDLMLHDLCEDLKRVYHETRDELTIDIMAKGSYDEVTSLDFEVERRLIDCIRHRYPSATFLSEEYNGEAPLEDGTWIIDPIDGTCNLAHGIETFGVQCSLFDRGDYQLAAIYLPFENGLYTALRGCGAWRNGEPLVRAQRRTDRSLVSFGDFRHLDDELLDLELRIIGEVARKVERVRMYGAASIDFAYCACGRLDGNFTFVRNPWDIAPGILLCREAGLVVTDAFGRPYDGTCATVAVFSSEGLMRDLVVDRGADS